MLPFSELSTFTCKCSGPVETLLNAVNSIQKFQTLSVLKRVESESVLNFLSTFAAVHYYFLFVSVANFLDQNTFPFET